MARGGLGSDYLSHMVSGAVCMGSVYLADADYPEGDPILDLLDRVDVFRGHNLPRAHPNILLVFIDQESRTIFYYEPPDVTSLFRLLG